MLTCATFMYVLMKRKKFYKFGIFLLIFYTTIIIIIGVISEFLRKPMYDFVYHNTSTIYIIILLVVLSSYLYMRKLRKNRLKTLKKYSSINDLLQLYYSNQDNFNELLMKLFIQLGYSIKRDLGNDYDFIIYKINIEMKLVFVRIGKDDELIKKPYLQKINKNIYSTNAKGAIIVTNIYLNENNIEFSKKRNIDIMSLKSIVDTIDKIKY